MIGRIVFVQIVTLAGIEDKIDVLVEKAFYMPVNEFCGIAGGIARHGVLPFEVQIARRFFAEHHFESARFEKSRPQGQLFVKAQSQRDPHAAALLLPSPVTEASRRSYLK